MFQSLDSNHMNSNDIIISKIICEKLIVITLTQYYLREILFLEDRDVQCIHWFIP